jgi:hypothetical protein
MMDLVNPPQKRHGMVQVMLPVSGQIEQQNRYDKADPIGNNLPIQQPVLQRYETI